MIKVIEASHPEKRIGQPEEVAPVVAMLAGSEGQWVNGQNIRVNGVRTLFLTLLPEADRISFSHRVTLCDPHRRTREVSYGVLFSIVCLPRLWPKDSERTYSFLMRGPDDVVVYKLDVDNLKQDEQLSSKTRELISEQT